MIFSVKRSGESFTGKEFDQEGEIEGVTEGIKAYHFLVRTYDPAIGLWMRPDPNGQFWASYAYTGNMYNPINGLDPFGLDFIVFVKENVDYRGGRIYYVEGTPDDPGQSYAYVGNSGGADKATPILSGTYQILLETRPIAHINEGNLISEDLARGEGIQYVFDSELEEGIVEYQKTWGEVRAALYDESGKKVHHLNDETKKTLYLHGGTDLSNRTTHGCIKAQEAIEWNNLESIFDRIIAYMENSDDKYMKVYVISTASEWKYEPFIEYKAPKSGSSSGYSAKSVGWILYRPPADATGVYPRQPGFFNPATGEYLSASGRGE